MILSTLRVLFIIIFSAVLGFFLFAVGLYVWGDWYDEWAGYATESFVTGDGTCNIAIIHLVGDIVPYANIFEDGSGNMQPPSTDPDTTRAALRSAESDSAIRGVLMRIDSGGGTPAASEAITNEFKRSPLPTVALIREMGASGAYLAATGADTIIASPFSDVGSIGITMSYLENSAQNKNEGLEYISLSSGKFKDSGSPDKPLTPEERALFERDLKIYHDTFVTQVSENRNMSREEIEKLADGSAMPGSMALEKKLVDSLGDQDTAREWFARTLGIPKEEVVFCE